MPGRAWPGSGTWKPGAARGIPTSCRWWRNCAARGRPWGCSPTCTWSKPQSRGWWSRQGSAPLTSALSPGRRGSPRGRGACTAWPGRGWALFPPPTWGTTPRPTAPTAQAQGFTPFPVKNPHRQGAPYRVELPSPLLSAVYQGLADLALHGRGEGTLPGLGVRLRVRRPIRGGVLQVPPPAGGGDRGGPAAVPLPGRLGAAKALLPAVSPGGAQNPVRPLVPDGGGQGLCRGLPGPVFSGSFSPTRRTGVFPRGRSSAAWSWSPCSPGCARLWEQGRTGS